MSGTFYVGLNDKTDVVDLPCKGQLHYVSERY